jgi:ribosomal protein S27E
MSYRFTRRRGVVGARGPWLLSGPLAVVLCLSGALAGAIQPLVMRPQVEQPRRSPDLLFGRDDCPGCEHEQSTLCQQPNNYKCGICADAKYTFPLFECDKQVKHFSNDVYMHCISQALPNFVCHQEGTIICWSNYDCTTSATFINRRCNDADPPVCDVQATNYFCKHCSKAQAPSGLATKTDEHCIPCNQGS